MFNIIAIDGPSGSGKGTVAKEVAKRLNYTYIDTGAMYRCVSLKSLVSDVITTFQSAVSSFLNNVLVFA